MNCAGCLHHNRDLLDAQLVQGIPYRSIAASFNLSLGAISRHKRHIKEMIQARSPDETREHGTVLYNRIERLVAAAEEILEAARVKNDFRGANGALGAAAKLLDLLGRVSGELQAAHAGGIHLTLNQRVTNTTIHNYDTDVDFAALIGEATKGFSVDELMRLKSLVANQSPPDSALSQP